MGKRTVGRLDENGLPRDPNAWTAADWRDLHTALETVRRLVGEVVGEDQEPGRGVHGGGGGEVVGRSRDAVE